MKKIYLYRIVRAAETFFLAASFSSHLFLSLARLTSSSCWSYDAKSRRKFEVAGREGKGICNFSQTFFIWSVSLIFSFLWYPLDKSSHTCGNGYYRTLRYIYSIFYISTRRVCFSRQHIEPREAKTLDEDTHVLDFRSVLSPLVSAELIERYSFRSIVPSTGLHDPLPLPWYYTREKYTSRNIRAGARTACRLKSISGED